MAQISSEIQDSSSKDESASSETSLRSSLYDHTFTEDSDLRSMVEENAFQVLSQRSLIKRPSRVFHASERDEHNEFLSLTFPKKLWKLVESDEFKSIWWDEAGTSIVINEELFKKEVLQRKTPFRIFETDSMKSLVRQLNLYGFSKLQQTTQRSASLAEFLAEEKEVSLLNKLQFYQNPNFKRGHPRLLLRMKRRVGIKNAAASVPGFNKKNQRAEGNAGNANSVSVAETRGESLFSASVNLNVPLTQKPSTSQRITNTADLQGSYLLAPLSISVRTSEQPVIEQHGILHQLTTDHLRSDSSYIPANGQLVHFVTTTISQYHALSPSQNTYAGAMMQPRMLPNIFPPFSANAAPLYNLIPTGNPWFPMPMTMEASTTVLSRSTHRPSSLYRYRVNYN